MGKLRRTVVAAGRTGTEMEKPMNQLMLPPAEAARVIGVGRTTFYGLMHDGQVQAVKIGRRTLVPIAELERYVASLTAGAGCCRMTDHDGRGGAEAPPLTAAQRDSPPVLLRGGA